jgi:hypothetical protein
MVEEIQTDQDRLDVIVELQVFIVRFPLSLPLGILADVSVVGRRSY